MKATKHNRDAELQPAPSRRAFLQQVTGTGLAVVAGAVLLPGISQAAGPLDYISVANQPSGGTGGGTGANGDLDILNFALLLERLEAAFYNQNVTKPFLTGAAGSAVAALKSMVDEIRDHENAHVALLTGALGANAAAAPSFQGLDTTTLQQFVTMAQTFEDVGVSAYLGQAPLIQSKDILAVAGGIMDIEARHAGGIRAYRKVAGPADGGDPTITLTEDREAVNRARSRAEVTALVRPFIVGA